MTPEYHKKKSSEHYLRYKAKYDARSARNRKETKEAIYKIKSQGCELCPERDPVVIDFHHVNGKDFTISSQLGGGLERVLREIEKCRRLCANCHRKVHAGLLTIG